MPLTLAMASAKSKIKVLFYLIPSLINLFTVEANVDSHFWPVLR